MADTWDVVSTTPTNAPPPPPPPAAGGGGGGGDAWDVVSTTPVNPSGLDDLKTQAGQALSGAATSFAQVPATAGHLIQKIPGVGSFLSRHTDLDATTASYTKQADKPIEGVAGYSGAALETMAEWMAGEGEVKALTGSARMANVASKLKLLEASPRLVQAVAAHPDIAKLLGGVASTVAGGTAQSLAHGADLPTALEAGGGAGLLHLGLGAGVAPLSKYLAGLKSEAAAAIDAVKPLPPPVETPAEPRPTRPEVPASAAEPKPIKPAAVAPEPITPAERPAPRVPAAERFAAHEQQAAQGVTAEQLEDLNKYRAVDANGTPTNIQQLGLPSQSATEPYQFRVPGWSATTEAGDLLHDAGARYRQEGTRVVEGKGQPDMKPWEMQQAENFDLPRYAQEPGAVVSGTPLTPPEPVTPPRESSPVWLQQGADQPTTSPFTHKEPIMRATEYKTSVRPGSEIREDTTTGGPSILTTDPDIAARHLDNIENIVQDPNFSKLPMARQRDILQSHNDVMQQMKEYRQLLPQHEYSPYLHQPTFDPVDINSAMARVGDIGDAAKEMMRGPKEMYNQWENLTRDRPGGSFRTLNDEMNDLVGKTGQASRQRLAEVTQELHTMFNGSDPYLGRAGTPTDLAIARSHFNNGYLVQRVDDAFTNAWEGANRTGNFNVGKLQSGWKNLVNEVGAPRMSNTLGPERFESMNDIINDLAGEPAADKAATTAAKESDKAAAAEAQAAADAANEKAAAQHQTALDEWTQREQQRIQNDATLTAETKAQHQAALDEWAQKNRDRIAVNKANVAEYKQKKAAQDAIGKAKQKWYFDVSRNGWHHLATGMGLEGAANLLPHGTLATVGAAAGKAYVLKKIITHPLMAKLAYQAARAGTHPNIYGPIFGDIIRKMNEKQPPPPPETQP